MLVSTVCRLKAASNIASSAATTTGKYSGLQPAITALIAAFSIVTPRPRAGRKPISVSGSSASTRSSIAWTRSGVGATIGSPSVQPRSKNSSWRSSSSMTTCSAIAASLPTPTNRSVGQIGDTLPGA